MDDASGSQTGSAKRDEYAGRASTKALGYLKDRGDFAVSLRASWKWRDNDTVEVSTCNGERIKSSSNPRRNTNCKEVEK